MTTTVTIPSMQSPATLNDPMYGSRQPMLQSFTQVKPGGIPPISGGPVSNVGTVDQYGGLNLGTATAGTPSTGYSPAQIQGDFTSSDLTLLPPEGAAATTQQTQDQGILNSLFGGISDVLGLGDTGVQQALGGLGGAYLAERAYSRLGDIGEQAMAGASEIGQAGLEQTEFRPFTVTTATGGMMDVSPEGGITLGLSPEEQALQAQLLGGAGQFFGQAQMPTADREAAIYERMRATMTPEEQRQRLALEERLAAQGRLGVRTAQYGGAPEQFALAQAQEEARNRAMLTAMQQAQAEQAQQAALGQQLLGAGYIPQAQLTAATQPAMTTAQLAQRGQLEGARLFGEAEMSGLEALLSSGLGQAELFGTIGTGLLSQALRPAPQQLSLEDQLKALIAQQGAGAISSGLTKLLGLGGG